MKAKKELLSVVWSRESGNDVPKAVVIRDAASSHFVLYALEEMNSDAIEALINGTGESIPAAPPVGTIQVAPKGSAVPEGWIRPDGRAIAIDEYPDLYAVIGESYTTADGGEEGTFRIPDLSGDPLRDYLLKI